MTKEEYKSLSRQEKFNHHLKDLMRQITILGKSKGSWYFYMLETSVKRAQQQNLTIPEEVENFLMLS
mgnify:FL=1